MSSSSIIGIVNNAALLLALGLLYDMIGFTPKTEKPLFQQVSIGLILGGIGIAIMLNPWDFGQGVLFDTRSVLLCICGFFFGTVPVSIAVLIAAALRLFMGGTGTLTGIAVIVTAGGIGLAWRRFRPKAKEAPSMGELYLLGIVVHLVMLACMFFMPWETALAVLWKISLPVILIYPLTTAILGRLLVNSERRRQYEKILKKSEEKFRSLFQDHSAVKLLIDSETGKIAEANSAAEKFYGWPESKIRKMRIQDINTLSTEQVKAEMEKARSLNRVQFEFRHRLADGSIRDVDVYSSRIKINGKDFLHSIVHDITDRKKAEASLHERERFLRTVVETAVDGFWVLDNQGKVTEVNDAYCAMSGYGRKELIGMHISDLDADEPPEETESRIERIIANGSELFEARHRRKDDSVFPIEVSTTYIQDRGGIFVCFGRDLSERKRRQQRIMLQGRMLDAAPVAIMICDLKGRFLYANQASFFMHGHENESDFFSVDLGDLYVPEYGISLAERLRRIIDEGKTRFEVTHCRRDGTRFPVEVVAKTIEWENTPAILSIVADISERKRAAEAISHSNDLMRYIIEHANSAVAVHDKELKYIYISQNYLEQYKVQEKEVIGKHHYEVFPDLPQKWRDVHQKALAGEITSADRDPYPRADGTLEWTRWECRPWYEADGSIGGFIVYTEVITDRVQAEEMLRQSEEYQRAMIAASPLAIISLTADGSVKSWNAAAERMFGWTEDEVLGKFLPIAPEDQQDTFASFRRQVINGESFSNIELIRRHKDGSLVEVRLSTAPMRDKKGQITSILAVLEDITKQKQAEKEQEKLQAQLLQAQKMESVGRLAGGVAHDYNNMLGVILGYTEIALEKLSPEDPVSQDLEEVMAAAKRSTDITRQLLAFSRQQTIAPKVLDLNETVEGMLKMLRRLIGEDIDLFWHPAGNLWPIKVDPTQLDQILVNLCVNARDAIYDVGKITIETETKTFDEAYCAVHAGFVPGDFVMVSVSDDGSGMDKETQQRLFEPFYTTKPIGQGTGLGLSTVYGIVRQNNGFINVYSEPGQGTTFRIYLPRHAAEGETAPIGDQAAPYTRGNETVLLVEDEYPIMRMTTMMLEGLGYTVLQAQHPEKAIEIAAGHSGNIHLLLTDVVMPKMNGRELSERLQAHYPDLKVLFTSGYTANVIAHRGVLDAGVNFIPKPFSKRDLAHKIREVLENNSR